MAKQTDFLKALQGASKQAQAGGWPGEFNPVKTVGDTFNSVLGTVGGAIGGGVQGVGRSIGDFSNMAQGNLGAVQQSLQGFLPKTPAVPRYDPLSSAYTTPKPKTAKRGKRKARK